MINRLKINIYNIFKNGKNIDTIILLITLIVLFIALYPLGQFVEPFVYDVMTKNYVQTMPNDTIKADDRIVIVAIDNNSIDKIGRWPWPRVEYLKLFDYLQNVAGAKVIAFDGFIRGADNWNYVSDKYFFAHLKDYPTVRVGFDIVPSMNSKNIKLNFNSNVDKFALKNVIDLRKDEKKTGLYVFNTEPLKEVVSNVNGMGSVLTDPDEDKKIRKLSYIFKIGDKFFPSLSLSTLMAYYEDSQPQITLYKDKININLREYELKIPVETIKRYKKLYNVDDNSLNSILYSIFKPFYELNNNVNYYKTWVKWYRPQENSLIAHNVVSAYKIFEALKEHKEGKRVNLNPEMFKDKIVIIGLTATAITASGMQDIKSSPLFPYHPGVDIQATAISNLLNADFMKKQPRIINIYILLFLIFLISVISIKSQDVNLSLVAVLLISLLYFVIVMKVLYPKNIVVDSVTPILYLFVTPMVIYTFQYFIERRKRGLIENVFSKFVSSEVMGEILKDPNTVNLGGDRAEITILFSDIRGFTSLSEKLAPEEISSILIEYFKVMEPIIKKHNGTVDNYIGDAIMAIFGAPVRHEDHAIRAVSAAVEMQNELDKLKEKWKKSDKPVLEMGIGINTGYTFLGYVGSKNLMHYTAIGDAVNIASRLENLNKTFNTRIIISQITYEKVKNYVEVRALKKENIRGRSEQVMIYELKGIRNLKDIIRK